MIVTICLVRFRKAACLIIKSSVKLSDHESPLYDFSMKQKTTFISTAWNIDSDCSDRQTEIIYLYSDISIKDKYLDLVYTIVQFLDVQSLKDTGISF